jgi:phage I-like protein
MAERASSKQYLVVDEDGKGHLPVRDSPQGPLNHHLMGAAWAALHGGYRGNKYEGRGKEAAIAKLKELYRSEGMELPDTQGADGQAGSWAGADDSRFQIQDSRSGSSLVTRPAGCLRPPPEVLRRAGERFGRQAQSFPATGRHSSLEWPRFVMTLAEPPGAGLIRIPIAVTGKWKGAEKEFSIGLDDLSEIRENFAKKPTREINVDYEHASEVPFGTGGPVLSAGRIVKLDEPEAYENGSGQMGQEPHGRFILWGWYEPTDRARRLIAEREYRHISPAIRWGAKDKVTGKTAGTVLTSVALVNKPFLEEMPEIHLCELDGTRAFVSLGQLHVPGPVNQISVAYQQPGNREQGTGNSGNQKSETKENAMAKSLKLKCLTDEHLEKHGLEPEQKGKIGVFDGEELIGIADGPEGWGPKDGNDDGNGKDGKTLAELFATEIGLPGKSLVDIAALVRHGTEAPQDQFTALSESIHDGRIDLLEAGKLADAGRVRFSTILRAQEAERKVEAAVKAGKVLPKNRAHALKLALSDAAGFSALVEQAWPVVDLRSHGHAGGGEQPTAQQALMAEVNAYAKENKCSVGVALSEVTKRKPDLWRLYSEEIVTAVEAAQEEE